MGYDYFGRSAAESVRMRHCVLYMPMLNIEMAPAIVVLTAAKRYRVIFLLGRYALFGAITLQDTAYHFIDGHDDSRDKAGNAALIPSSR